MATRSDVSNALSRIYRGRRTVALSSGAISGIGSAWGANSPNVPFDSAGTLNALSPSKLVLQSESADVNWIVVGDSTGVSTVRWIYLWFAWLATQFPRVTFVYYPPDGAGAYGAPTTVQTGTGSRTFRLYNSSVSGTNSQYVMGSKFTAAFVTPGRSWDMVLWNHGKNQSTGSSQPLTQGEFMGSIAQVQLAFPNANHLATDQYPNRDNTDMSLAHTCWLDINASDPTITVFNQYSGATYVSGDYLDNPHLSDAANTSILLPLAQAFWNGVRAGAFAPSTPWLQAAALNLLNGDSNEAYGDFEQNGNGTVPGSAAVVPAGWASSGTNAFSQEASIVYGAAARSQKIQGSGAAQTRIGRTLTATKLALAKSQSVTLTVLHYVPSGSAGTVGRQGLLVTGGTTFVSRASAIPTDGWRVQVMGPIDIPSGATVIRHDNYHDSSATPDATHPTYTDRAHLALGRLPRIVST